MLKTLSLACLATLLPAFAATAATDDASSEKPTKSLLTIGSIAPSVDIENWVQDGEGRFEPINGFQPGQVYVVEFWATWCPPCIASIPHLSELQKNYADRGVTIIGVSDEKLAKVTAFLDRETEVDGEKVTFGELTKAYCLTSDPDRSTHDAYMQAAKRFGIPCSFIVGKDGRIEWIGMPLKMDDALEQVVSDSWDRDAFAILYKAEQDIRSGIREATMMARRGKIDDAIATLDELIASAPTTELAQEVKVDKVDVLSRANKPGKAIALIDELLLEQTDDKLAGFLERQKVTVLIRAGRFGKARKMIETLSAEATEKETKLLERLSSTLEFNHYLSLLRNDQTEAVVKLQQLVDLNKGNVRNTISVLRAVVDQGRRGSVTPELLTTAVVALEPLVENDGKNAMLVDTLARLVHMQGDLDRAIELSELALANAKGRTKSVVQKFVDQLKEEKEGSDQEAA